MNEEEIRDTINKLFRIEEVLKQDDEEGHGSAYEMQFEDFVAIHGLLDIIKKRQKEIEELKAITRTYKAYNCREDDKIVFASKEYFLNGYFKDFLSNYISKDKIKEKIEEYKKKCNECNFQNTGVCEEFKAHYNCSIQSVLELLKELIGD